MTLTSLASFVRYAGLNCLYLGAAFAVIALLVILFCGRKP